MGKHTATGIDVGTHRIRVVTGERGVKNGVHVMKVRGTGEAASRGLRHGYIVDRTEATESIREALEAAQARARIAIREAYVSIGGIGLEGITAAGTAVISRADSEITSLDVEHALTEAERSVMEEATSNRRLLHTIPLGYKIDGKEVLGRPAGMKGVKLEAQALLITCLDQHARDLIEAVEEAGVEVSDIIAAPLAAGLVNLTKTDRIAGVVLANIGSETVSVIVYENNLPISLKVFPIGSTDITNDIALGLQIPLEEAEEVKIASEQTSAYPKKKIADIISARLTDIFELINSHLKKIKRDQLLPAGVVLTGGGSGVTTIQDLAKGLLKLPSTRADVKKSNGESIQDASWSVAYGLCKIGLSSAGVSPHRYGLGGGLRDRIRRWTRQLLP